MMIRRWLCVIGLAWMAAACASGDGATSIDGLSAAEVQERVTAALFPSGHVLHTRETYDDEIPTTVDIWRDTDAGEARWQASYSEIPQIWAAGRRYPSSLNDPDGDATGALRDEQMLFGDATGLVHTPPDKLRMKRVSLDGADVIRVTYEQEGEEGTTTVRWYISGDFLPLRVEFLGATYLFEHEALDRGALPADFFSPDVALAAQAAYPSPPASWRRLGLTPYWLGPEYAGTVLSSDSRFYEDQPLLVLHYSPDPGTDSHSCFDILQSTSAEPLTAEDVEARSTFGTPIGEATIYERIFDAPVPGFGASAWQIQLLLDEGGALQLVPCNVGTYTDNVFNTAEGLTQALGALRAYDGPEELQNFPGPSSVPQ